MAVKYYAVVKGKKPGIYRTWADCKAQTERFSGAVYKSFPTEEEAQAFMERFGEQTDEAGDMRDGTETASGEGDLCGMAATDGIISSADEMMRQSQAVSTDTHLVAYVDGSYEHSRRKYAYGCALVLPDRVETLNGSGNDPDYVGMRNVAGEILGSEQAILWAIEHGYRDISIYYDYEGIEKWAEGIWKANKPGTKRYQAFIAEQREKIGISFCKVAAHTGVEYNELADRLAKEALGL